MKKPQNKRSFGQVLHRCMVKWLLAVSLTILLIGPHAMSAREWAQFAEFWMWVNFLYAVASYLFWPGRSRKKL